MKNTFGLLFCMLMAGYACGQNEPVKNIDAEASATIVLKGYPDWLEVDDGAVWVSNDGLLQRIDPVTNKVIADVKVNGPCAAITIGFGSVWTLSCSEKALIRIDSKTNAVVASIPLTIADDEGSIVAAEDGVWILSDRKGVLTRVDPTTNKIKATISVKPNSFAAMAGFGSVWITNTGAAGTTEDGSVQRIDPKTNKVTHTITVGRQPRFLAVGEGGVWAFNQTTGSVTRIDPITNKVVATIECGLSGTGGDIAAGEGYVWVRGKSELLVAIDPKSNKVVRKYGPPAGSGAVRVGAGSVWVSAHDVNKIWRLRD